jgi:hypothetical protein
VAALLRRSPPAQVREEEGEGDKGRQEDALQALANLLAEEPLMANYKRGRAKSAAAKRGHKNTTTKKSHAGVRKAARARWRK